MKAKSIYLSLTIVFLSLTTVFGQSKTDKFKVYGSCGMCETRIEKTAKSIDGVTSADWNKQTQVLEVTYDESKTNVNQIQISLAKVGHDTDKHKTKDETYNALPGCCKYKRPVDTNKE